MMRFMIGGVRLLKPAEVYIRAASEMSPGEASSVSPRILSAARACCISLAPWVLSWMAPSRAAGSSMSVASEANMAPTLVPTSPASASVRSEIGTWAMRGEAGSSSCFSR